MDSSMLITFAFLVCIGIILIGLSVIFTAVKRTKKGENK